MHFQPGYRMERMDYIATVDAVNPNSREVRRKVRGGYHFRKVTPLRKVLDGTFKFDAQAARLRDAKGMMGRVYIPAGV